MKRENTQNTQKIAQYVIEIKILKTNINNLNKNLAKWQSGLYISEKRLNQTLNCINIAIAHVNNIKRIKNYIRRLNNDIAKLEDELKLKKENLNNILEDMIN
jgi:cell division protein FtsB